MDREIDHARVYQFENDGQEALYLAPADWMTRNLHGRIEVAFPIYDPQGRAEIKKMPGLQLREEFDQKTFSARSPFFSGAGR